MNLRKYIAASANHSHTLNRTATTVYRLFKFRFYRNLKELKELKGVIAHQGELEELEEVIARQGGLRS